MKSVDSSNINLKRGEFFVLCLSSIGFYFYYASLQTLSIFLLVNKFSIIVMFTISIFVTVFLTKRSTGSPSRTRVSCGPSPIYKSVIEKINGITPVDLLKTLPLVVTLLINMVVAFTVPPNNWDSMTYHLPRLNQWLQNGSIFGFNTQTLRQVWNPRGSEALLLIPASISQNDVLLNLVQFVCFILVLYVLFILARLSKVKYSVTICCLYLVFAFPTFLLQSVTTKNDVVGAYLSLVAIVILWLYAKGANSRTVYAMLSCSIAACFSIKGTTLLFGIILVFSILYLFLKKLISFSRLIQLAIIIMILNSQLWIENLRAFGSPLSPDVAPEYNPLVTDFSLPTFVNNIIRITVSNLLTAPSMFNEEIIETSRRFISGIGLNPDDPDSTWSGGFVPVIDRHEDLAGSPVLIFVFLTVLAASVFLWKRRDRIDFADRLFLVIGIIYCFASILTLRWQPWINRLLIPAYLILVASLLLLEKNLRLSSRRIFIVSFNTLIALFTFYSATFLAFSVDRPILTSKLNNKSIFQMTENELRFINNQGIAKEYSQTLRELNKLNPEYVLINGSGDHWEYPVWKFAKESDDHTKIKSILDFGLNKDITFHNSVVLCIDICKGIDQQFKILKINVREEHSD
jgi:hypothetical protein